MFDINLNFAYFISRVHLNADILMLTFKSKHLALNNKYKRRAWFRNRTHTFGKITSVDWQLVAPHYPLRFRKKAFLIPSALPSRRRSADTCPQVIGTATRYDARRCVRKKMRRWTKERNLAGGVRLERKRRERKKVAATSQSSILESDDREKSEAKKRRIARTIEGLTALHYPRRSET